MPGWPCVVQGTGHCGSIDWFAICAEIRFSCFDDLVAGIEAELPSIVADGCAENFKCEILISGWSRERRRPEAYSISTIDNGGPDSTPENDAALRQAGLLQSWKLMTKASAAFSPPPNTDLTIASNFEGVKETDEPEHVKSVMRLMLEMQRHHYSVGLGAYIVGGFAEIAVITPEGVENEIVRHWSDRVGESIQPEPIDWLVFRESIGLPRGMSLVEQDAVRRQLADLDRQIAAHQSPRPLPCGLSRLKRERLEKKARKGTLRLVS